MQKQKGKKILVGAIAVAALMCLASAVPAIQASDNPTGDTRTINVKAIHEPIPAAMTGMQGNVRISTYEGDDASPAIASSSGRVAVVYQKIEGILSISNVFSSSTDGGESWTQNFENIAETGLLANPDIVYNPTNDEFTYCAAESLSDYGGHTIWFNGDMSEVKYGAAWSIALPYDMACTSVGSWTPFLHSNDDYNPEGLGLNYWRLSPDTGEPQYPGDAGFGAPGGYYDGEMMTDTSPGREMEIDAGSQRMYFVIEHPNETTGQNEVVYKETYTDLDPNSDTFLFIGGGGPGGMDVHADIEVWPWQGILKGGTELYSYEDPDVSTSGNKAAVVYQTTENNFGDLDIHCTYTADNGESWETSVVADNHPDDDTNPVVYMSGNDVYCVYVSGGNLYLAESNDGGATWGEPEQVNEEDGTVVAEKDAVDVGAGGIVWTDTRNGAKDIYYAPLPAPNLGIDSIGGGMGVTATVSNTGTEDASDVAWTIELSGPVFLGNYAEGTIDTLAAGDTTTISTGFVLGIGPTTISVDAGGATGSASGFVLGPLVLGL